VLIIPAVDIKNGRCVRLIQGNPDQETVYSNSPVDQAKFWESQGAKLIHIVDLDGAFSGIPNNLSLIKEIRDAVNIDIELGGGIRDLSIANQYIQIGINRIIIGSSAFNNKDFIKKALEKYSNKIILGIDVVDGNVAIHGWKDVTDTHFYDFANEIKLYGAREIILTDIKKDGMLTGIDVNFYEKALENIKLPIIASGGISNINDIKNLIKLKNKGLKGAILGKSLYEKKIDLQEALKVANAG